MKNSVLIAVVAWAIGVCQTASADFVEFEEGKRVIGGANVPQLRSADLITQTHNLEHSVFRANSLVRATFNYSGDTLGPGNATFNWTINNNFNTIAKRPVGIFRFDFRNFVGIPMDSVRLTGADGGPTFPRKRRGVDFITFVGKLAPNDSNTFVLVADFADLPDSAVGTFALDVRVYPEPSSLILLGIGTVLLGGFARLRKAKSKAGESNEHIPV